MKIHNYLVDFLVIGCLVIACDQSDVHKDGNTRISTLDQESAPKNWGNKETETNSGVTDVEPESNSEESEMELESSLEEPDMESESSSVVTIKQVVDLEGASNKLESVVKDSNEKSIAKQTPEILALPTIPVEKAVEHRKQPIGIFYFLWHCVSLEHSPQSTTEIIKSLNVNPGGPEAAALVTPHIEKFRNPSGFSWWDWPDSKNTDGKGYCLSNNDPLLREHAVLLRDAGIDFIVLDVSNHSNIVDVRADAMIMKPFEALLRVWSDVPNAPKIVPWVAFQNYGYADRDTVTAKSMLSYMTEYMTQKHHNLLYFYEGKPLIGEVADEDRYTDLALREANRNAYKDTWRLFKMWGNRDISGNTHWSFLANCRNFLEMRQNFGIAKCDQSSNSEVVPVTIATEGSAITEQSTQKFYGRTFVNQFEKAFKQEKHNFIFITGWNEWVAGPHKVGDEYRFIDAFDFQRNRDIEPSKSEGNYYYLLMKHLIHDYRTGKEFFRHRYYMDYVGLFDSEYYAFHNSDVVKNIGNGWKALYDHWRSTGIAEGRVASRAFNVNTYKKFNTDLTKLSNEDATKHFIERGFYEGRVGSTVFHAPSYLLKNEFLQVRFGKNYLYGAYLHYKNTGNKQKLDGKP